MKRHELILLSADFIIRNDTDILVGIDSIYIASLSVSKAKIRDMWDVIRWAVDIFPDQHRMVKGNAQRIFTLFDRHGN